MHYKIKCDTCFICCRIQRVLAMIKSYMSIKVSHAEDCTLCVIINFTDHSIICEKTNIPVNSKQELEHLDKLINVH